MSDNYPLGAQKDPNAPYNEQDLPEKEITVTVSITLSKTLKINVTDYEIRDAGKDEDGNYYEDIDYSNCDLEKAVKDQIYLPYEACDYFTMDSRINEDLSNWNIDDFEVIKE